MGSIAEQVHEAVTYIRSKTGLFPRISVVLGTGLGGLTSEIDIDVAIPYSEIPGFETSTVEFHEGKLIVGNLAGQSVVAMQGRFHYYEGFSMQAITFPIRVMKALGAEILIISNAAGGVNRTFSRGDLVLITDFINLLGNNPLIGVNEESLGPRFIDMSEPYSNRLIKLAREVADSMDIPVRNGVYAAMQGPCLETRAEYRFLGIIGADMVGMSTVPETIVAVQMGMDVLGVTIISDMCIPEELEPVQISEIIATCNEAEPKLTALVKGVIEKTA